jgi:hypothetical protein
MEDAGVSWRAGLGLQPVIATLTSACAPDYVVRSMRLHRASTIARAHRHLCRDTGAQQLAVRQIKLSVHDQ